MRNTELVKLIENFQTKMEKVESSLTELRDEFRSFKGETAVNFFKMDQRLQIVENKTNNLDRLYNAVDRLMGELDKNDKERAILLSWYHDHEDRILSLEQLYRKIPAHLL